MDNSRMKYPNDRLMAHLMESMEDQVSTMAGSSFDLAAGKQRFVAWLAEGDDQADDEKRLPEPATSGERLGASQLGYSPFATRMLLGTRLRRLREAAGVLTENAGYQIRASASKISRMELGRISFKERDVSDLLDLYGVTDQHARDELFYLMRQANEPDWWRDYADVLPEWHEIYLGLEGAAVEIRTYDAQHVPELLQTDDYARALARQANPGAAEWEIDRRLQVLKERQAALTRSGAPRLRSLIDDAALQRQVGGTDVMRDQLRYLAEAGSQPGVTVQVISLSSGASSAVNCSFTVLRFADPHLPDVTYIEQLTSALYLERQSDVECYIEALDALEGHAAGPARTAAILRGIPAGQRVE
jgi:hypothetical protein